MTELVTGMDKSVTGQGDNGLRQVSRANEKMKTIVSLARHVDSRSINARLLARQAGTASQGFRVAAAELGAFSREMDSRMMIMETVIARAVNAAAEMRKLVRRQQLFQAAAGDAVEGRIRNCVAAAAANVVHLAQESEANRRHLLMELGHAGRLGDTGRVVGRLARLEAVYGGSLAKVMAEAIADIEGTVAYMVDTMRELTRHLESMTV